MSDSCTCSCSTNRRRRRPTATLVIASLALFMSLGGTSYAAVKAKSIGNKQLKNNAVTSGKIARNGVTASDIRARVIDGSKIQAGSIGSQHILDGSIGSIDIANGSIGAQDIQPGSIGAGQIGIGSINGGQIANGSLGPEEFGKAMIDYFRNVPALVVASGEGNVADQGMPSTGPGSSATSFTTVRSFSAPAKAPAPDTNQFGTNLVQSLVAVSSADDAVVSCWISVGPEGSDAEDAAIVATATVTVSGNAVIPVTASVNLAEGTIVQTRCRADGGPDPDNPRSATADTRTSTGATSMTLMRVAD